MFRDSVSGTRTQRHLSREATLLVLTRKSNQSIMIGDEIEISVLAVMGEKVRIGISAPRSVPVFRKEVYLDIKSGQEGAADDERKAVAEALDKLKSASA